MCGTTAHCKQLLLAGQHWRFFVLSWKFLFLDIHPTFSGRLELGVEGSAMRFFFEPAFRVVLK
jgi:hypothetical protein